MSLTSKVMKTISNALWAADGNFLKEPRYNFELNRICSQVEKEVVFRRNVFRRPTLIILTHIRMCFKLQVPFAYTKMLCFQYWHLTGIFQTSLLITVTTIRRWLGNYSPSRCLTKQTISTRSEWWASPSFDLRDIFTVRLQKSNLPYIQISDFGENTKSNDSGARSLHGCLTPFSALRSSVNKTGNQNIKT